MKILPIFIASLLSLPAMADSHQTDNAAENAAAQPKAGTPTKQTPQYSEKHKNTSEDLAELQDELQADASDLIMDETKKETVELLKKCRSAMNDAIDYLEVYNTGGQTLAAQSDVIELIYQASKSKMQNQDGQPKPGSKAMMDMLRQMLGMNQDGQDGEPKEADGESENGDGDSKEKKKGDKPGKKPGEGGDGKSNMAANQEHGTSDPNAVTESRTVPKSAGVGSADMPTEFQEALEAYNKTLQK